MNGEVQEVLGPRMFTIDESEWIDLDGETLVVLPAPLAALVNEEAPVTVTGTVRMGVITDIDKEWGWFGLDPGLQAEFEKRPMIVADSITNAQDGGVLAVRIGAAPGAITDDAAPGNGSTEKDDSGSNMKSDSGQKPGHAASKVTDLAKLASSTDARMVGDHVDVQNAKVAEVEKGGGFWVTAGQDRLFVLPAQMGATKVTVGQTVAVEGVVLQLPAKMKDKLGDRTTVDGEQIYVYAEQVTDAR